MMTLVSNEILNKDSILPGSASTPVFSKIRADVAKDFVGHFPEHFDFIGMLRRVCENFGVRVIKRPNFYRLEGHWSPIGKIYDTLTRTLEIYGESETLRNDSTSDPFDDKTKLESRDTPTPQIHQNSDEKLQITSKVKGDKDIDPDDDGDDENHEYNSLKNTISDICSSLGNEEELTSVKTCNMNITKTDNSFGKKELKEVQSIPETKKNISINESSSEDNTCSFKTDSSLSPNGGNNKNKNVRSFSKKKKCKSITQTWNSSEKVMEEHDKKATSTEKCYSVVNTDLGEIGHPSHLGNNDSKIYKCVECNFTHKNNTAVREHFSRIHRAKPTKCKVCQKLFPSERYAKRHCDLVHRDTQYCCDVCGRTYKFLRSLEDHLKSHKDGYVKPDFPCGICEKTFSSHYVLKCHTKSVHYGENRTYLCPVCGKSFTTKHSLNMHQNVHSGSRPFTCDVCGKSFMYDSALRDHKFVHSGKKIFECEICKKAFQQRSGLQMHVKIHQEKKAYECKECGRAFIQKQSLQRHERSHKGEKPFYCKICGRSFGDSGIIRRHLIMVHKINKDTKCWREDIVEKGRGDPAEENDEGTEEDVGADLGKDSDQSDKKTCESQKQIITEPTDNDTNQSSISHLKYQEDCVSDPTFPPSNTTNLEPLPASPTNESQPPNLLHEASDPTCLPDAQSFITIDYCRPLTLPSQLPPLANSSGEDTTCYSIHPHQHSPYLNPPVTGHLDPARYHYTMACSQQAAGMVTDTRYTLTQTEPNNLNLPRVDSVLNKCLHDMEPPENLSISSLYAYYTSLASQYLTASQYQGYSGTDSITHDQG